MLTEKPLLDCPGFIRAGDLVFDIGANVGSKAALYLAFGARVVCVEPQPYCVAELTRQFRGNLRVVIVAKGLAEKPGELTLSICSQANTISTFNPQWKTGRFAGYKWDKTISVPVTTLDELILEHGLPRYCKLDVEGSEISVLKGLTRTLPLLSFGFTREFMDNAKVCVAHLQRLGFQKFNFTQGEDPDWAASDWRAGESLLREISQRTEPDLWGDIFACDVELDSPPSLDLQDAVAKLEAAKIWKKGQPLRLHLGCGENHFEGYINVDYPPDNHQVMNIQADAYANILHLRFPPGSVDEVRLHHVFEHFNRVTALALLIRWHSWLRPGGLLRVETPDLVGSAKTLASTTASLKLKMAAARHLAGDQADAWAYHLESLVPQRDQHTLPPLGFDSVNISTRTWTREPFLANVEVMAVKRPITLEEQLAAADALLWESAVAEVERPIHEVWRANLRAMIQGASSARPANLVTPAYLGTLARDARKGKKKGFKGLLKRLFGRSRA